MQILAHLYSISSHLATAAIHPGNHLLPFLNSSFLYFFVFLILYSSFSFLPYFLILTLVLPYSLCLIILSIFLSFLTTCFLFLISRYSFSLPFHPNCTTSLPSTLFLNFSLLLITFSLQAVRKVSNRDAALRIMRGNRRSPTASACSSPYSKGISPTVEEDRAIKEAALEPER